MHRCNLPKVAQLNPEATLALHIVVVIDMCTGGREWEIGGVSSGSGWGAEIKKGFLREVIYDYY